MKLIMIRCDGSCKRQGQVNRETLENDKRNQARYRVIRRLPYNAKRRTICQTAPLRNSYYGSYKRDVYTDTHWSLSDRKYRWPFERHSTDLMNRFLSIPCIVMTFRVVRLKQSRNKAWDFLHHVKITLLAPQDCIRVFTHTCPRIRLPINMLR